ncbi:hypothetical protein ACKGJF_002639 [Raoultella ornithinolytica]|uniref:hypothetical protein n=1 Tax=Raoultella ornithinolytica TaxID=54291 RepID=UPI000BFF303B|nr:hypothetical protein [Raoultella ornithinolytica]ATM21860.1 hypothetical protein CRN13_16280 [Raoultella ornithinolytica]ELT0599193.1 hypothetical protein [Raoultella ornithinolytica]ELT0731452.1 hypothetical protein [Raoultella ornithinolytica]VEB73972.1 Uncharacterised protein [Raoultella ornithinolytica]
MARQRLNGDIPVPTTSAADTFDDIPQARKQAIREEVMDDYYARLQAVKKEVDAMTITQREMFHRSLTETLALLSVGETKK